MCMTLEILFDCFCDTRVIEITRHYERTILNSSDCKKLILKSFQFHLCPVCMKKLIIIRKKVKNVLLCIERETPDDFFYNDSVCTFVQKEIKYESYQFFHQRGFTKI